MRKKKEPEFADVQKTLFERKVWAAVFCLLGLFATFVATGNIGNINLIPEGEVMAQWQSTTVRVVSLFFFVMGIWYLVSSWDNSKTKKRIIIDVYSFYIKRHSVKDEVKRLRRRIDDPKEFRIALLEMLVPYGEDSLKDELAKIKGERPRQEKAKKEKEPEPEPEPIETTETKEERDRIVESRAWIRSEFAKKVRDKQTLKEETKKERLRILKNKELSPEEADELLEELLKAEKEIVKKLEVKDMLDE